MGELGVCLIALGFDLSAIAAVVSGYFALRRLPHECRQGATTHDLLSALGFARGGTIEVHTAAAPEECVHYGSREEDCGVWKLRRTVA